MSKLFLLKSFPLYFIVLAFFFKNGMCDENKKEVSFGFETGFNSQYIDKGIQWSESFVIQPEMWISYKGFTLCSWGNISMTKVDHGPSMDELDLILNYILTKPRFDIEPSISLIMYPYEAEDLTGMAELSLSYKFKRFVTLSSSHSIDIATYLGAYSGDLGIKMAFDFTEAISTEISVSCIWSSPLFNEINWAISPIWTLSTTALHSQITWYPLSNFYLILQLNLDIPLDRQIRDVAGKSVVPLLGSSAGLEF